MEEQNFKKQLINETDLLQLLNRVVAKWKFISSVTIAFMLLGIIVALCSIKLYTSEIMVAPESSAKSYINNGLGAVAGMFGVNLESLSNDDAIYPLLYPDIIKSLPFLSSLFSVKVQTLDGEINTTYYDYISNYQKKSIIGQIKSIPKRTVKTIGKLISSSKKEENPSIFDPYKLSERQKKMVEILSMSIGVFVDKKTNVVTVSYTDQDPLVAAMMTDTIMTRVQQLITEYRTKKIVTDYNYIEKLFDESKLDYEAAQLRYAEFVDKNRNITQERYIVEKERLEADKDMKNSIYTQWAQQLMLAKARVQEKTPVFVVIKPAAVSPLPSSMRKSVIVIIYTIVGLMFAVSYVMFKTPVKSLYRKIFKNKTK
ncbi:MAG: chain-length determining protein [Bacteroidales bacterium]|nr:chain-length determining protein [Bacteroidales bacterium]MBO5264227.1 chain-length determining protein [Bacteroidaceae bacterium]